MSTRRDTEHALLVKERFELETLPEQELQELIGLYEAKGLSRATATIVATELTEHDAFAAHVDAELHIDPNNLTNPWNAAIASAASFVVGGVIPLIAIIMTPESYRFPATLVAVLIALIITGSLSAHAGGASKMRATIRVVLGGIAAMAITYGIGKLFGVAGI